MTRIPPKSWSYETFPDPHQRLGKETRLVVRVAGDDYTILAILPGPELAERFVEALRLSPHESLFDMPIERLGKR